MSVIPSWQSFLLLAILVLLGRVCSQWLWRRRGANRAITASQPTSHRATVIGAGICALLLVGLATALLSGDTITALDVYVRARVPALYDDAFVQACMLLTSLGDTITLVAVTLTGLGLLWAHGRQRAMAGLVISALGSQVTVFALKYAIDRERPPFTSFVNASTPSFPSAHATGAIAVYGFIIYLMVRQLAHARMRFETAYWGTLFVMLLAASRVIIGVHYLSDVVAGLLVGLFWLLLGRAAIRS